MDKPQAELALLLARTRDENEDCAPWDTDPAIHSLLLAAYGQHNFALEMEKSARWRRQMADEDDANYALNIKWRDRLLEAVAWLRTTK